jgi:hypothetical protein
MMRKHVRAIFILLALLSFTNCASEEESQRSPRGDGNVKSSGSGGSAPHEHLYSKKLDPSIVNKVNATFEAVLNNDEKKAKLLYGRNYKVMPEVVQFALDVRFKNFEHALQILPQTGESSDEMDLWRKILSKKPAHFSQAVCQEMLSDVSFPHGNLEVSQIQSQWNAELKTFAAELRRLNTIKQADSDLQEKLDQIQCQPSSQVEPLSQSSSHMTCPGLSSAHRKEFLNEAFFDKLHNMQRRDTAFIRANYRNYINSSTYIRYANLDSIFKLYKAMLATDEPRIAHFLKRVKGVGRDIRPESMGSRVLGDEILNDPKDYAIAQRLNLIIEANPILSFAINLDSDLSTCGLNLNK